MKCSYCLSSRTHSAWFMTIQIWLPAFSRSSSHSKILYFFFIDSPRRFVKCYILDCLYAGFHAVHEEFDYYIIRLWLLTGAAVLYLSTMYSKKNKDALRELLVRCIPTVERPYGIRACRKYLSSIPVSLRYTGYRKISQSNCPIFSITCDQILWMDGMFCLKCSSRLQSSPASCKTLH